jgi:epoxyqueuosine reductase
MMTSISDQEATKQPERSAADGAPGELLKQRMMAAASAAGFAGIRVTTPAAIGQAGERLRSFLADGRHGDMGWMATTADRRADPSVLWPLVRSIILLGVSYAPAEDPLAALANGSRGAISCYAHGEDYHDDLGRRLKQVAGLLARLSGEEVKVFVDTAPLMEKPLAQAAGLGWQGKHTNLVSREHGSWLFLGAILTTAELPPDEPEADHCGSCRRCLDVCPTEAFPAPYQLDARRCIAYLTIEHKGHIAPEFRKPIGNRVFGCDDCLAVCPWNKFAKAASEARSDIGPDIAAPPLAELLQLDDAAFRRRFAGTPLKRTGRNRFVRNVLIGAGNSGDRSLMRFIEPLMDDASPLVRAMAAWASGQLCRPDQLARLRDRHLPAEADPYVRGEWAEGSAV